jgi:hypothetical protein
MKTKNNVGSYLLRGLMDLLKGGAAALAGLIGLIMGGWVASLIGLPTPVIPAYINVTTLMPLILLTTLPIAIVLGEAYRRLPFTFWPRFLALLINNYLLYSVVNTLDAFLYSPMPNLSTNFFSNLFPALFTALILALVWRPEAGRPMLRWADLIRPVADLKRAAWRILLAVVGYTPIYILIGLLVAPFTKSYYAEPSHTLGLVLPSLGAILLMQLPRGLLFLLAVWPFLSGWRGSRPALWVWTGVMIFIQVAGTAIFQAYWLPAAVRIPHAIEILTDSFLQAGLYALLLVPGRKAGVPGVSRLIAASER